MRINVWLFFKKVFDVTKVDFQVGQRWRLQLDDNGKVNTCKEMAQVKVFVTYEWNQYPHISYVQGKTIFFNQSILKPATQIFLIFIRVKATKRCNA